MFTEGLRWLVDPQHPHANLLRKLSYNKLVEKVISASTLRSPCVKRNAEGEEVSSQLTAAQKRDVEEGLAMVVMFRRAYIIC